MPCQSVATSVCGSHPSYMTSLKQWHMQRLEEVQGHFYLFVPLATAVRGPCPRSQAEAKRSMELNKVIPVAPSNRGLVDSQVICTYVSGPAKMQSAWPPGQV